MKRLIQLLSVLLMMQLAGTTVVGYFTDTFDGPALNARWTPDNSPANVGGSTIAVVAGEAQPTQRPSIVSIIWRRRSLRVASSPCR